MALPVIFIGHGSPMNAIESNEFTTQWQKIGQEIQPKAILMISAHWFVKETYIQNAHQPKTINDLYRFPKELYKIQYKVSGDPLLTQTILNRLTVPITVNNNWGIDHGAWSVLNQMYPNQDIPVVQLSINATLSPEEKFKIGQQLKGLRNEEILIIGSGNIVHNLSRFNVNLIDPYPWAKNLTNL